MRRNLKHLLTARVKEVAAAAKEGKARATGRGRAEATVEGKGNVEAALHGVALHGAAVRGVAEEEGINRVLIPNPACAFAPSDEGYLAYKYVREVARDAGLSIGCLTEGFLRYEYGEPVTGLIVVLQKPDEK